MNINSHQDLCNKLDVILQNHPEGKDACKFINGYFLLCHAVDDIIDDKDKRNNSTFILKTFGFAVDVYSSLFYQRHISELYPLVCTVHDLYCNSVEYEKAPELWKNQYGDVLRHSCNILAIYIIRMLLGYDVSRDFSLSCFGDSYIKHHTVDGKPI